MKQTFILGTIPSNKDKYFDEMKKNLKTHGAITEFTPDEKVSSELDGYISLKTEESEAIKNALEDNGLISENLSVSGVVNELNNNFTELKPENIKAGVQIGSVNGTIATNWTELDFDHITLRPQTPFGYSYSFFASNGIDAYFSYSGSSGGIVHFNRITAKTTTIYSVGGYWRYFFEDSKGNIYASSSSYTGIVHLQGETATLIHSSGRYWQYFFEDSKGDVYVSSSNSSSNNKGVLLINEQTSQQVYNNGYGWGYFLELKNGDIIVGSDGSYGGMIIISDYIGYYVNIYSRKWQYLFESSNGDIYACTGQQNVGIYHISGTIDNMNGVQIYSSGYAWSHFAEDNNGNVYVGGDSNGKILCLSGTTVSEVSTPKTGYAWDILHRSSDGTIFVSSTLTNGLYRIKNKQMSTYSNGNSGKCWDVFYEDSKNCCYFSSSQPNNLGLLAHFSNKAGTIGGMYTIYSSGYNWCYFQETSKGTLISKDFYTTPGSMALLVDVGDEWKYNEKIYEIIL